MSRVEHVVSGQAAQQAQFKLTHRPFQASEEPIIDKVGIVDAIIIAEQRFGHCTQLDQMMPVSIVAGQA